MPVSLRRVSRLFGPYRARLSGLLTLIFVSAGLGVISPFLLREVLDRALPKPGEGPSEKLQREGRFKIEIHTRTSTGPVSARRHGSAS